MPVEVPLSAGSHGQHCPCSTGSDIMSEEVERRVATQSVNSPLRLDLILEHTEPLLSESHFLPLLDISEEPQDCLPLGNCLIQDGSLSLDGCVQLERKWVLWHEFMKECSSLCDWLQLAEKSADSPRSAHVLFVTAKEELKKFESLRTQAGARLVQLDSLTLRNRTLTRLFDGAMRSRLLGMAKDCGQRWDRLHGTIESVCRRLKHCVSQREEFDGQREEMAVWLADMDLRLTEVEHFSGRDTCDKMRELQSFQEAVGENAGRLNCLLERGEALIQRSEPEDAQDIEAGLQELLLYCAQVFEGVGHLHTRLLSMRLVYEDDWVLTQASDSGCPSEVLLEQDGVFEKGSAPDQRNPTNLDHMVLEWDPSVDIGGPVSQYDVGLSYFSAHTDREKPLARDGVKRRSYLSSIGSQSDLNNSAAEDMRPERRFEYAGPEVFSPPTTQSVRDDRPLLSGCWMTSTPDGPYPEPVTFDPARISAWLGQTHGHTVPSRVPSVQQRRACSKAVQTDSTGKSPEEELHCNASWEVVHSEQLPNECPDRQTQCSSWPLGALKTLRSLVFLVVLLAVFLALLVWPTTLLMDLECHRSNSFARTFQLALSYVNGPPPT
ncbi:nesprin-1-like isoform 1-T5 [Salvelinus alpinus]|uniref:nesprin-1-like n=1 Tax=Salvelinus alpinus TaxID=8036 RepID=UPI0039FD8E8B